MEKNSTFSDVLEQLKVIQEKMITEVKTKRQEYEVEKNRVSDEIKMVVVNVEEQHKSMLNKVDYSIKQLNKTKNQQRSLVKEMLVAENAGDSKKIKELELKLADLESEKMTLQAIASSYENPEVFEVAADRNKLMNLYAQLEQIKFDNSQFLKSVNDIQHLVEQVENMKKTVEDEIKKTPSLAGARGIGSVYEQVVTEEIFNHEYLNQKYDPYRPRINKKQTVETAFNKWMQSNEDIKFSEYFPQEIERLQQEQIRDEAAEDAKKRKEQEERDERNRQAYEAQTQKMNASPPTF